MAKLIWLALLLWLIGCASPSTSALTNPILGAQTEIPPPPQAPSATTGSMAQATEATENLTLSNPQVQETARARALVPTRTREPSPTPSATPPYKLVWNVFALFLFSGVPIADLNATEIEEREKRRIYNTCMSCHMNGNISGSKTILSYSRALFGLPDGTRPLLHETTFEQEVNLTMEWKRESLTWRTLQRF